MTPSEEPRPFTGTVAFYQRYRLAYPDRLIARVAGLLGLTPGAAVLDLGCGTGMLAIPLARLGMTVTAMDPDPDMLDATGSAARDAGVAITLLRGGSQDLTPGMGPFRLVVMGRSFHWMDRAATLTLLDKIVTRDGGVALFHDAHPPAPENGWFKILCDAQKAYRREAKTEKAGHRRYESYLFASAFSQLDGLSVTVRQALALEDIVGRAFSISACAPHRLGSRAQDFATRLAAALREVSPDGKFTEVAELVAVLARRPKD